MFNFRPPWLYVRPRQPEDSLPGFHVAPETLQGVQPAPSNFTLQPYVQDTSGFLRAGPGFSGAFPPPDGSGNPLDFLTGQGMGPTSSNDDLLLPNAASLLFPRMGEPQPSTRGLQDFEPPPEFVPGFHVASPDDDRVGARDIGPNDLPDDADNWIIGYNPDVGISPPIGIPAHGANPPDNESFHSAVPPAYDPVYFPESPRDHVKEALDQIARIYGGVSGEPFFSRPNPDTSRVLVDSTDGSRRPFTNSDVFDPRFIVPAQVNVPPRPIPPPRPPQTPSPSQQQRTVPGQPSPPRQPERGPGDNNPPGPPPTTLTPAPSSPPPQSPQGVPPPRPATTIELPNQAGPAAAAPQRSGTPPQPLPNPQLEEAWPRLAKVLNEDAPDPPYDKSNGQGTGAGIFVDRRLPPPAAGWKYNPPPGHLRSGYVGELRLANRIVTALKDETVIHYGMPAGVRGPDIISVAPDGTISVWDSKWRTGPRLISSGGHQHQTSLDLAWQEVQRQVDLAVKSGRLSPETGQKARENAIKGDFLVITVGTGSAHGGVVKVVQNGRYSDSE
jgi:hypothetical protein